MASPVHSSSLLPSSSCPVIVEESAFINQTTLSDCRLPVFATFAPHSVHLMLSNPAPGSAVQWEQPVVKNTPGHDPPADEMMKKDGLLSTSPSEATEVKIGGSVGFSQMGNLDFLDPEFVRSMPLDAKLRRYYENHFPWTSLCAWLCNNLVSDVNSYAVRDKVNALGDRSRNDKNKTNEDKLVSGNNKLVVSVSVDGKLVIGSKRQVSETTPTEREESDPTLSPEEVTVSHGTHKRFRMDMLNVLDPIRLPKHLYPPAPAMMELREFCFQYPESRFRRFIDARTPEELQAKAMFSDPLRQTPLRIEVGAAYTAPPSQRSNASPVVGESKELVLDIDITDYNDVRPCCRGSKTTCSQCWSLIRFAMKLITAFLRANLGIACVQWVYSGQKGVHCWIPGAYVARMTAADRSRIMRLLNNKYNLNAAVTSEIFVQHHKLYMEFFLERITKHQIVADPMIIESFLDLIPCDSTKSIVKFKMGNDSVANWNTIHSQLQIAAEKAKRNKDHMMAIRLNNAPKKMMIYAITPRVDEQVARVDHLIKVPFSIHPGTMKVCVPIGLDNLDSFEPEHVPTLDQVISQTQGTTVMVLK